jgi:hypothetical protein
MESLHFYQLLLVVNQLEDKQVERQGVLGIL